MIVMAIDIESHKKKLKNRKPNINLVPLIDILFTLLIFIVITSNFSATDVQSTDSGGTGKPNVTDTSGTAEYYVMPVDNLHSVIVNNHDMSDEIRNNAVGVHSRVIDEGQVSIRPGEIIITTPSNFPYEEAVRAPEIN